MLALDLLVAATLLVVAGALAGPASVVPLALLLGLAGSSLLLAARAAEVREVVNEGAPDLEDPRLAEPRALGLALPAIAAVGLGAAAILTAVGADPLSGALLPAGAVGAALAARVLPLRRTLDGLRDRATAAARAREAGRIESALARVEARVAAIPAPVAPDLRPLAQHLTALAVGLDDAMGAHRKLLADEVGGRVTKVAGAHAKVVKAAATDTAGLERLLDARAAELVAAIDSHGAALDRRLRRLEVAQRDARREPPAPTQRVFARSPTSPLRTR